MAGSQEACVISIVSSNFSRHVDSTATQREYPELETAIGISTKCKGKKRVFLLPSPTKTRLSNKVFTKAPQPHEIKGKTQLP